MATTSTFCLAGFLFLTTASLSSAWAAAPQETPIEFLYRRPVQKALGVTIKETHDLLLTSLTKQFGDAAPIPSTVAMRLRTRFDSALAEEFVDTGAGPGNSSLALRRRYLGHAAEIQTIDPDSVDDEKGTWNGVSLKLESPLEGTSVVFVAAEGQPDGFGRHYDAVALREAALPKLSTPTDWSQYLRPAGDDGRCFITLGDRWDLDVALLEPLIAPGGFLGWRTEKPKEGDTEPDSNDQILRAFDSGVGGNLQIAFDGEVNGTAEAWLQTVGVDPDNGRFGQIEIAFDLEFHADRDAFVETHRLEDDGELDLDLMGGDLVVRVVGTALINWGLDLARPFSCLVEAKETLTMAVRMLPPGRTDMVVQAISMDGTLLNGLVFKELPLVPAKRTVVAPVK